MLNALRKKLQEKKAFTLVEIMIVVAITAMLSSFAIGYSRISARQVTLFVEQNKIASLVLRAKSLTLSTYTQPVATCGYGVAVNYAQNQYEIFSYTPPGPVGNPQCDTIATSGIVPGQVKFFSDLTKLNNGVQFQTPVPADGLYYILFIPPDPTTLLSVSNGGAITNQPAKIYLQTVDGNGKLTVTLNTAGQVDY